MGRLEGLGMGPKIVMQLTTGMNLDRAAAGGARHGTGGGPMRDRQYGDRNGFSGGGGAHSRGGDARARPY